MELQQFSAAMVASSKTGILAISRGCSAICTFNRPRDSTKEDTDIEVPKNNKGADKEPIVFQSPNLKPDVCLSVFGQEFHVHSTILRLLSTSSDDFLIQGTKKLRLVLPHSNITIYQC